MKHPRRKAFTLALLVPLAALVAVPSAEAATERTIKVVTYNVGDAGGLKADLVRLIETERPAVLGLQEVADREDVVREAAAATGYVAIYETDRRAIKHNAILVRGTMNITGHGAGEISPASKVDPSTPGTGPAEPGDCGCWVPPKYVNWVRVGGAGFEWVVGVVHLTPSAQRFELNRELHNLQVRNTADWFSSRVAEPIVMGDFNAEPGSDLMAGMRRVADSYSAPSHGDRSIDHVWAKKDSIGSAVDALGGYGSDHRPVRARVTVTR
ncbi:endonuclease/exonuclease/phosphatase family protein [Amycolatopsis keratiniphila]|uniref:Endonuclease/exonuclease/phosphatase n=1 Tax=Amycolatopsis keratiniphila TaxID=129921 RepID=R4T5D2_9PSEU|nr:endonuclease/exonuclease/phosphatase family protein [Amycolatopsis keratiniphila]AGM06227.1 endonuclease/exonuclease/phosphatase [Amycolatopsis keratiniphila]